MRHRRRTRRITRLAVNVACLLVTLLALAFILPAAFGLSRFVMTTDAMQGTIDRGAVVFEEAVPVADVKVGDVITYMPPAESGVDRLVTSRVVSIDGDTFRTQGDAEPAPDPWTFQLAASTQTRVVAQVPYLGFAFVALADRGTRLLVIGVPALLVAAYSVWEMSPSRDRRTEVQRRPVIPSHIDIPLARTGEITVSPDSADEPAPSGSERHQARDGGPMRSSQVR